MEPVVPRPEGQAAGSEAVAQVAQLQGRAGRPEERAAWAVWVVSAALMPSHVAASLISTRSRGSTA